jgi:homopolymeric O-antigen transport system ATP-binding protein
MRPIVSVRNLSKSYRLGRVRQSRRPTAAGLAHALGAGREVPHGRGPDKIIWALRDVSFDVRPGETVGIIGRNGAGKSTLLKILSRIVRPTAGEVDIYGRMGSLLEIGTGFHPDLTGRENVYLNGAIIGMKRGEIRSKFDEIVAFAEVEQFLDTPIKYYSSGMHVRLAFAVAAHFEPEILVLDEVLAVGDAAFQQKCFRKMQDVSRAGRTTFFVSHDLNSVQRLCGRALFIESGRLQDEGPPEAVIRRYLDGVAAAAGN